MKTTGVQKSGYHKAWMSAGIFLTTVIVGGLAIFAATNLDDLKAGANGNMLTALNRDSLIDHVKNHDLIIGEGLSKLDTDILRVESKVDGLSGVGQQGNEISFQLSGLMSHVSGINTQITNVLEIFEGNESGSALVEEIDTIKLIVENNNAVINENYEKLDEKLEQLTYLISQMQCEGGNATEIPQQIYTTVSASAYLGDVTVVSCEGTNCKTYSNVLDTEYSNPSYTSAETKETGLVASAYLGDIDIATCKGTGCKIYDNALDVEYSEPSYKVLFSEGTVVVASAYLGDIDIATCKGTGCKIYDNALDVEYSKPNYTVTASNGIITVTSTYGRTTKTAKCQGTTCQIY